MDLIFNYSGKKCIVIFAAWLKFTLVYIINTEELAGFNHVPDPFAMVIIKVWHNSLILSIYRCLFNWLIHAHHRTRNSGGSSSEIHAITFCFLFCSFMEDMGTQVAHSSRTIGATQQVL
jgi:hypothetical protein